MQRYATRPLVIGLPSLNEAETISSVVSNIDRGLCAIGRADAIICHADNGSTDDTPGRFLSTNTHFPKHQLVVDAPHLGKAANIKAVLEFAASLSADCMLFDTDLTSITPAWVTVYAQALDAGFDYVTPFYRRGKHAATVTNTLIYPLFSGVLGIDVRQPIGGDFGLSADCVTVIVERLRHDLDVAASGYAIDSYMSCVAVESNMKICAGQIGKKVHRPKSPALQLKLVLVDTAIPVFDLIIRNASSLDCLSREVPRIGRIIEDGVQHPGINTQETDREARARLRQVVGSMRMICSEEGRCAIDRIESGARLTRLTNPDWVTLVFDTIAAVQQASRKNDSVGITKARRNLIAMLHPFYLARVIDFVMESQHSSDDEAEALIRSNALEFAERRPELITRLRSNLALINAESTVSAL